MCQVFRGKETSLKGVQQNTDEKDTIVFDDAFIRKAFKGDSFFKKKNLSRKIQSGYDMDGDGEISTREFKIVMKR